MNKIHFFCAGGTIDKIYFDAKSDYQIGEPAVIKMLDEMPVHFDFQVTSLLKKDSLEMDDADREVIRKAVLECDQEYIVITHGTDTMPETARALNGIEDKVIVLTGALAPAIFRDTDALFNVGCALTAVQASEPGVYIAMNGILFDGMNVRKDVENERFEKIE